MLDQFQQMPKGMKILMAALTGTSLLGVLAMIDPRALIIVVIGLVLVVIAVIIYRAYVRWQQRKRARALSGQLTDNSSAAPNAISDPARRAKLDSLRQNFGKGMEKFRAAGKDLYSLPWYVVCGEPGSGKTEAVRHCNVGFPPGLQDEMQGAGGTLNMHWWFTNQAVLLDTAGKLLFQEAPAGTTSEWTEFLSLLKKARPNCPINGLLLVIPAESLIKDSFEDIQRKAGKIAQQLDRIQKTLDVRFPVFVLITKCDLINGFREFFSGIKDPQLQNQMTGWSNSEPLDTPFRPEAVDSHLEQVVQRVGRRRLGLLKDPVPADPGVKRVDEVDALFALPSSIGALAPRLRKYLETIFVANEWSGKPLFLRGIYFTSALTEGAALDAELASALGIPAESLPDGKAWERERSFFLRDLFLQKIFKEQGLVTRATNTSRLLRQRQWILGSVVLVGLSILIVLSVIGRNALKNSVGGELAYWQAGAREADWSGGKWHPIVDNGLNYIGGDPVKVGSSEMPVLEFHEKLQQKVVNNLAIPWVFKPLESIAVRANPGRRKAQRVLFEASVVGPLVDANREMLLNSSTWNPVDVDRLAELIELEGAINLKGQPGYVADFSGDDFFGPLLSPSLNKIPTKDQVMDKLVRNFEWTYRTGDGRGQWPAVWLERGRTLRDNPPIARGFESLEKAVQTSQAAQRDAFQIIQAGRLTVGGFLEREKAFLAAASAPRTSASWKANVDAAWAELSSRRAAMDTLVDNLKQKAGVKGDVTLDAGYKATVERMRSEAGRASQRIRASIAKQKLAADAAANASTGDANEFRLYRDLQQRLVKLDASVASLVEQALPPGEQAQLADLDAQALKPVGGTASYAVRADAYAEAMQRVDATAGDALLGKLGPTVGQQIAGIKAAGDKAAKYDGAMRNDFATGHRALLDAAGTVSLQGLLEAYRKEFDAAFSESAGFPLGNGTPLTGAQLKAAVATLDRVRADAADAALPVEVKRSLEDRFTRAERVGAFASALLGANGEPLPAKLVVIRDKDQAATVERVAGAPKGPRVQLTRVYPSLRLAGRDFRIRGLPENIEVGRFPLSDTIPPLEFSTTPDPKAEPDARAALGVGWSLVRLLSQGAVRRADGLEWDAVVRLREDKSELVLAVTIVLEKPLPSVDRWPEGTR